MIKGNIKGVVNANSQLSGLPDIKMSVSDKFWQLLDYKKLSRYENNIKFHNCIRYRVF